MQNHQPVAVGDLNQKVGKSYTRKCTERTASPAATFFEFKVHAGGIAETGESPGHFWTCFIMKVTKKLQHFERHGEAQKY